jgi:HEAT repeats
MPNDDLTLLREYARHNSEEAFAALVSRHVNLVYSVALRQVRDVAVPALLHCLQNPKSCLRENAVAAPGSCGGEAKSAVPALTKALEDSDSSVRRQAASALKQIDSGALPK